MAKLFYGLALTEFFFVSHYLHYPFHHLYQKKINNIKSNYERIKV